MLTYFREKLQYLGTVAEITVDAGEVEFLQDLEQSGASCLFCIPHRQGRNPVVIGC